MEKKLIQNYFEETLGKKSVLSEAEAMKNWAHDWTNDFPVDPLFVLFPKSTKEVSDILAYCNQNRISLVPSGGRTGLAGGCTASNKDSSLDVVQNTLIKLYTHASYYKNVAKFSTWIFTIAKNNALTELRKNKRKLSELSSICMAYQA